MSAKKAISIERADFPEQVGVSSRAIAAFIDDLNDNEIETHSLMILRDGKVAFESWAQPFSPDIPHIMFSVSKSVTSTAIGFAIEEGLLSLDTRVLDVLPEYKPTQPDENLEKLTVFHLLTMTAGKDVPTLSDKTKNRWVRDFFDAKWAFAPGEFWRYISENQYMLCVMLTRVTGMSVSEYLRPRLYEPLGFKGAPFWERDGNGIETGGWGMKMTTEELAKITLCYQQGGKFNGKQIIPAWWAKEAVKKQVENLQYSDLASTSGYGYCFWRNPVENSYRADGLFSQFGMVFEDYDACLIMTASEIFETKARDCVWRHFPGMFTKKSEKADAVQLPSLKPMEVLPVRPRSRKESAVDGKILKIQNSRALKKAGLPVSMLIQPVIQLNFERLGNIEEVRFVFDKDECAMTWREGLYKNTVVCGMDGKPRLSKVRLSQFRLTMSCTAAWENEHTLCVWVRPLEAVGERRLRFVFRDGKVSMIPSAKPDGKAMMDYLSGFVGYFVKGELIVKGAQTVLGKADRLVEKKHVGRIRE